MSHEPQLLAAAAAPWLQRKDWAENRIACSQKAGLWFAWIFTTIWCLLSVPLVYVLPSELAKQNHAALIGLIFPAVGIALIRWSIKVTRDWLRFGAVFLSLDPLPGVIGGRVGGTLNLPTRYSPEARFLVTLSCRYSSASGSGKNRRVLEKLVWQAQGTAASTPFGGGTQLRFAFEVPGQLPASEVKETLPYHRWSVEMKCEAPFMEFWREFTIPVYPRTRQASPGVTVPAGTGRIVPPSQA